MIYVTGDTHREISIHKLTSRKFPQGNQLTKDDYVIVVGDFGFLWDCTNSNLWWLNWISSKPFTTLFVDGNHENFDMLNSLPETVWNGGKAHVFNNGIVHLMRGQVFTIEGLKFFTFGGAESIDKADRIRHISWWPQEEPTWVEYEEGLSNLALHNNRVDYVLTHTCPAFALQKMKTENWVPKPETAQNKYFDIVSQTATYKHWYFGHFHMDRLIDDKHTVLFNQVVRIV